MINEYLKYKRQREKIKARQRVELDTELEPQAIELGRAIHEGKRSGKKITEIAFELGLKNRTFIYKMLNAYLTNEIQPDVPEPTPAFETAPEYSLDFSKDKRSVDIVFTDGSWWTLTLDADGNVVDMPEEWVNASKEDRKFFSKIIKDVESHGVTPEK